jgi:hypothetical protein
MGPTGELANAKDPWAVVAFEKLIDTARRYNDYVTYKQLADEVQTGTGITTKTLLPNWIGAVLGSVADRCQRAANHDSVHCLRKGMAQ